MGVSADLLGDIGLIRRTRMNYSNWRDYLSFRSGLAERVVLRPNHPSPVKEVEISRDHIDFLYNRRRLRLLFNTRELKFTLFVVTELFVNDTYGRLNVKGKRVVDVGASIADSPIYFVARGARAVYGFEPSRTRYGIGMKNIRANSLSGKIKLFNRPFRRIPGLRNAVLKVDCEGCEYALFRRLGKRIRDFEEIIMEYHHGNYELAETLRRNRFTVELQRYDRDRGLLYARRKK